MILLNKQRHILSCTAQDLENNRTGVVQSTKVHFPGAVPLHQLGLNYKSNRISTTAPKAVVSLSYRHACSSQELKSDDHA